MDFTTDDITKNNFAQVAKNFGSESFYKCGNSQMAETSKRNAKLFFINIAFGI